MLLLSFPGEHDLIGLIFNSLNFSNMLMREPFQISIPLIMFHQQPFLFPHQVILIVQVDLVLLLHILLQPDYILVIQHINLKIVFQVFF